MHGVVINDAPLAKAPEIVPPTFKPHWWYKKNRLDARPVIWSLYNHPKDWSMSTPNRLLHAPSNHEFWVGSGKMYTRLYDAQMQSGSCSCLHQSERGRFQRFQKGRFWRAYQHWNRNHNAVDADHFAAHFISGH